MSVSTRLSPTLPQSRRTRALRSTAVGGDRQAFAALYEQHHQALYRYCRSILHDEHDAQDALQMTMMKAFSALETEQRDFELRPWLFRIAHNESISLVRRRRETTELPDHRADGAPTLHEQMSGREDMRLLREDMALLTEQQRSALVLRELSGLGHAEIAQVLDSSSSAVKQTIYEARASLLELREGRDMACEDIRRLLSDGDGRTLRGRRLRSHVRSCAGCRSFQDALRERPKTLAALAPPLPLAAGASLLHNLLATGGSVGAGSAAAGSAAGGGAVGGGVLATGLGAKLAVVAAVAVTAGGGATAVVRHHEASPAGVTPQTPTATPTPAPSALPAGTLGRHGPASGTRLSTPSAGRPGAKAGTPTGAGRAPAVTPPGLGDASTRPSSKHGASGNAPGASHRPTTARSGNGRGPSTGVKAPQRSHGTPGGRRTPTRAVSPVRAATPSRPTAAAPAQRAPVRSAKPADHTPTRTGRTSAPADASGRTPPSQRKASSPSGAHTTSAAGATTPSP